VCIHCGCGQKSNRHGNANAITIGDVHKAMGTGAHQEGGKGPGATATEMKSMVRRHGRSSNTR
jgi:hypothetical protein